MNLPIPFVRIAAIAAMCLPTFLQPVAAQEGSLIQPGFASAFLTGRIAVASDDFARMAQSYDAALEADPGNETFRELAMQGWVLSGEFERAAALAAEAAAQGEMTQIAAVILQADEFKRDAYASVIAGLQEGRLSGPLTDAMGVAWAELGKGSMSDAIAAFEAAISERVELAPFALYHQALAHAFVGDMERAADILAGESDTTVNLSRRGVLTHMTILSQLGRFDEALELGETIFGGTPDDDAALLMDALREEQPVPFTTVTSARDGMAEVYFSLAGALIGEPGDWLPIIYGQLTLALRPDHGDAILLTGQLLERVEQYDLADQIYGMMPQDNPQYLGAQLGRANALYQSGQVEDAVESLVSLSELRPDSVLVFSSLGDMLRREERYEEAAEAYTSAIDLIDEIEARHWVLLYTRAISYERMGEWELAEPEFRRTLEFVPDEPQVLNYLGYSLIEKRTNLDEALDMIERAVEGEPDSGYITDSLGWAYYRLGRYEEAVPVMERAVELLPRDPILNDHLGDVYWAVGRTREARFQWRRALSFAPHPDLDVDLVRRKLEIGKEPALEEFDAEP
ncbi:tetratricopeptide repeat protein [Roseinatronobacter monicus]|uniref:Tetratricopeptide repeat protein n=1 Tax=Roseinatronobacter monicus TaxID=393481 RepID=A0A543KF08_9RHOB|nr:tetratricopeptide repeat protein [Roseinatronobacter monicus]TQM93654.1 tetratricopeptide repeat protein [Roseinatronobacter monicus]